MEDLNKEYEKVLKEQEQNLGYIKVLKELRSVQRYLELCDKQSELNKQADDLYEKILLKRYANCEHVLVLSDVEHDYMEGRSYPYYGCVKCGFDSAVAHRGWGKDKEEKKMLQIMEKHKVYRVYGTYTDVACKVSVGKELWDEIKNKNPDLSDSEIISIFKKRAKAKKLSLNK